jgi:hypothetical protein
MYSESQFNAEFARLKKSINYENIDKMLKLIDFCEGKFIDDDVVIDSEMDVMKYTLKVLDNEDDELCYECASDIIWSIIEDIETGGHEVYQKSTGYGQGSYELPEHKKNEWKIFKEDILDCLESYDENDCYCDNFDDFDDRYDPRDDYDDYQDGYYPEVWDCLDM